MASLLTRSATTGDTTSRFNRHLLLCLTIVVVGSVLGVAAVLVTRAVHDDDFTGRQYFSIASLGFLLGWWLLYFNYQRFGIVTLRAFLRDKNPYRKDGPEEAPAAADAGDASAAHPPERRGDTDVVTKAAFSVGAQGILIAIIALFLDLTITDDDPNAFQEFLRPGIVLLALLTILMMVMAIDILDTAANVFRSGECSETEYRRYFNSSVGPGVPKGGASYAYFGFALFSAYIVLSLSYFFSTMAGFGIAIYAYLSYPFLFGYRWAGPPPDGSDDPGPGGPVEVDESAKLGSYLLGGTLLAVTIIVIRTTSA